MKDYIILTAATGTQETDLSISWNINPSCFKSMKQNDRLKVKLLSCGFFIDNNEQPTIGGNMPIYCDLSSANLTTDNGFGFLGCSNYDVATINTDVYMYGNYISTDIEVLTNVFSKIKVWLSSTGTNKLDATIYLVVLEISYYKKWIYYLILLFFY